MVFRPARPRSNIAVRSRSQRGAALILALVVVVTATVLATAMGNEFLVTLNRVENQLFGKQSAAYMQGGEGLARSVLMNDYTSGNVIDHISEGWLDSPQEFPFDQGIIVGRICDLQGRFNLNNLASAPSTAATYNANQELFIRLLQTLPLENPLDRPQAEELSNAITDWIDADDRVRSPGGAEDSYYADLELAYRPGNRLLHSVSELRWVKDVSDELYAALEPYVVALPKATQLNVNTASARVLRSINTNAVLEPITDSEAEALLLTRDGELGLTSEQVLEGAGASGFESLSDFVADHPAPALDTDHLSLRSDYFLLESKILFLEREAELYSVLYRDSNGNNKTIARARTGLGRCYSSGN